MLPVIVDTVELAAKLHESYDNVSKWAREGDIPAIQVGSKRYYNLGRVIEAIREKNTQLELATA